MRIKALLSVLVAFGLPLLAEMKVSMGDAVRAAINKPQPEYSPIAKQMKIAGTVEVEVTIAADGTVENVKPVSGNPMLTSSVLAAVKKWKFTPFEQGGQPSKAIASLSFNFKP